MTTALDREVEHRLAEHQLRYTTGRQTVIEILARAEGPLSAAEIHDAADAALPVSSIYRTLSVLEGAGVLAPHHGTRGLTRYELAEWLRGHHHHLVCIDCGAVEDVAVAEHHETQVGEVVSAISSKAAFTPINHALEIEGRCIRCA